MSQINMKAKQKKWIKDILGDDGIMTKIKDTKSFLYEPTTSSESGLACNHVLLGKFIDLPAENTSRTRGIVRVRRTDAVEYVLDRICKQACVMIADGVVRKEAKSISRLLTYHKRLAERSSEQRHPAVQRLTAARQAQAVQFQWFALHWKQVFQITCTRGAATAVLFLQETAGLCGCRCTSRHD
ncbi:unnamed protein product [Symbiodinium sp. CCMP2592]|nr:unnamed protein product [Symbiodinium sp. CCMP2592]